MSHATLSAKFDASLHATLSDLLPLKYAEGGDAKHDVPAHVRAASSIRRHHGRLVIVQDDVNVLALRDTKGSVAPILLPVGPRGGRTFSEAQGNKKHKMDLEASTVLPDGRLIAFGSGSSPLRESIVVLDRTGRVERRSASELYEALRAVPQFSGSELNVEGALVVAGELLLFQRGNGATMGERSAVNAIGAIDLQAFIRWLDADGGAPALQRICRVDLGTIDDVPFGFTDAALTSEGAVVILACAEDTVNAIEDGPVLGCRFGIVERDEVRVTDVLDTSGRTTALKLEGIEPRANTSGAFDVVTDLDNSDAPALIGRLSVKVE